MKRLFVAAAIVAAVSSPIQAKEITLPPLTDDQQSALVDLIDVAVKSCGIRCTQNANFFIVMIQEARKASEGPVAADPGAPVGPPIENAPKPK